METKRIIHSNLIQGSAEWLQARLGKITASQSQSLMAAKGLGKGAETYALELIAEIITEEPKYVPVTWQMEHGHEYEPVAREIYELNRKVKVRQVGGIQYNDSIWYSPDGLVGNMQYDDSIWYYTDGLIEIKCPQPLQHLRILTHEGLMDEYYHQIQFGLYASGRAWCDWISYQPNFPDDKSFKVIRVERDEDYIRLLDKRIHEFKGMMKSLMDKI